MNFYGTFEIKVQPELIQPSSAVVREAGCYTKGSNPRKGMDINLSIPGPTSGCAQKLVDGRCQVHSSVKFADLAVRSFPWFSPKLA